MRTLCQTSFMRRVQSEVLGQELDEKLLDEYNNLYNAMYDLLFSDSGYIEIDFVLREALDLLEISARRKKKRPTLRFNKTSQVYSAHLYRP